MSEEQRQNCEPENRIKGMVKYADGRNEEISFRGWPEYSAYIDEHAQEITEAHGELN